MSSSPPAPDSLEALFARFRDDADPDALGEVFDRTAPALLRVAMHLVRDAAAAEDLLQETFVEAIEGARRFDERRRLWAWLFGILLNRAKRHLRRRRRERKAPATSVPAPSSPPPPPDGALTAELDDAVAAALAEVPSPYREVLVARLERGRSSREIALELGRSPGAVRMQVHRGLALLRRLLPPGLALGALAALPARGLGAVRADVIRHALSLTAPALSAGSLPILGGLAMSKKTLALAGLGLVVLAGAWSVRSFRGFEGDARAPAAEAPARSTDPRHADSSPPVSPRRVAAASGRSLLRPIDVPRPVGDVVMRGRVVSVETGAPLPGARVVLRDRQWPPRFSWHARSDGRGRFRLERIDPRGALELEVEADGHAPASFHLGADRMTRTETANEFDAGDLALSRGARLQGVVLDARGVPVRGAAILVSARRFGVFVPGAARAMGRSDERGRFDIACVPARADWSATTADVFAVSDFGIAHGTERVVPGAVLSGLVLREAPFAGIEVRVTGEGGAPIGGATVTARPRFRPFVEEGLVRNAPVGVWEPPPADPGLALGPHEAVVRVFRCSTDEAGRAALDRLPVPPLRQGATYDVVVRAAGHRMVLVDGESLSAGCSRELEVVLSPVVPRAIEGRMLSVGGDPLPGREVGLRREIGSLTEHYPPARTDGEGRFRFDGLTGERPYRLWAVADGRHAPGDVAVTFEEEQRVAVVELRLERSWPITGRLVDDDGVPLAFVGLGVMESPESPRAFWTKTDVHGAFRVDTTIPGQHVLEASLWPQREWVETWPRWTVRGGSEWVVLTAARRRVGVAAVDVAVLDAVDGSPLDPESARLKAVTATTVLPDATVERGVIRVENLSAGDWVLHATIRGRGEHELPFTVVPGELRLRLRWEIPRTGSVIGRVVFAGAAPVHPVRVLVDRRHWTLAPIDGRAAPDRLSASFSVLPGERFHVGGLKPGPVSLRVLDPDVRCDAEVEVAAGTTCEVDLAAQWGASLQTVGMHRHASGRVELQLADRDGAWRRAAEAEWSATPKAELALFLRPGPTRWRLLLAPADTDEPTVLAEGTSAASPGDRILAEVPRPPALVPDTSAGGVGKSSH